MKSSFSLSMIIYGVMSIATGGFNDKFGPRSVLTICGLSIGAGHLFMSRLSTLWQLYLFIGVLISTGMSGIWVPQLSTISRWFIKRRSLMSGIAVAGMGIGGLIGPVVVGRLIEVYDWRLTYTFLGIAILLVFVPVAQLMKRDPAEVGQSPYGENDENEQIIRSGDKDFTFNESIVTLQFWLVFFILIGFGYCCSGIMVHIVPHAIVLGLSPVKAANILAVFGGVNILGVYMLGGLGDKIGNRQVFLISCLLIAVVFSGLVAIKNEWLLIFLVAVCGFAFGGMGTVESPLVAWLFGLGSHGLIYGVIHIGFTIGGALGPFVMGYLYDITGHYNSAFLTGFITALAASILTILLKPTKR